jgi:hypothetical protein
MQYFSHFFRVDAVVLNDCPKMRIIRVSLLSISLQTLPSGLLTY